MARSAPRTAAKNIQARRKLSELYSKGVEVRFGPDGVKVGQIIGGRKNPALSFVDPDGNPTPPDDDEVSIWVQPPSPIQRDMILRAAGSAQARALLRHQRDKDSEEYLTSQAFLAQMSIDTLIDYLVTMEGEQYRVEAIRDVLGRDEWKDIDTLRDALTHFEELGDDLDEDDPEYVAVMERDFQYGEQVAERQETITDAARQSYRLMSREELERKGLDRRKELVTSKAFMKEYEDQTGYYSCRDVDNHGDLFFESITEWRETDDTIKDAIKQAMTLFIQDGTEAKNSPRAASGSPQSTPPSEPEISESSTQQEPNE